MESLSLVMNTVTPVFFIILVGYIFGKIKKKVNLQPIVDIIFYIASPCLVFSALVKSSVVLNDFFTIIFFAFAVSIILGIVSFSMIKRLKSIGLVMPMSIGNTGYLGYPIALLAFGLDGLSKAVIYDNAAFILLLLLGIPLVHKGNNKLKELLKAAPIYGIILGVIFSFSKIAVPDIIFTPVQMIGNITIPAALIVLGYRLSEIKVSSLKTALFSSLFKIFAGFFIALLLVAIFGITGTTRNVILILAAMPSAVMAMILAEKYKRDAGLVASVVFISTLLSIVSIPLILYFLL